MATTATDAGASKEANKAQPLHLSFAAFSQGCQAYLGDNDARRGSDNPTDAMPYTFGWKWAQHDQVPQLSHLTRSLILPLQGADGSDENDEQDVASAQDTVADLDPTGFMPVRQQHQIAHVRQSILYSSTWHVPVLWIDGWVTTTSEEVLRGLTIDDVVRKAGTNTLAPLLHNTSDQQAYFPPVTFADHPTYNCAAMYLHPCQTAQVVGEMLGEDAQAGASADIGRRYLEAFIAVCASAVEMRGAV